MDSCGCTRSPDRRLRHPLRFAPAPAKGKSAILGHRLAGIDPRVSIQIFELDGLSETLEKVDPCAGGNIVTWLVPRRQWQLLIDRAAAALAAVLELAPQEITVHASTQDREVVCCIFVACLLRDEQVYEQAFAQTAAQHGILDLLGIARAGRLAILELNTAEDLDLEFLRPEMARSHPHRPDRKLASRPPRDDAPVMPRAPQKYSPCSDATLRYDSAFSQRTD